MPDSGASTDSETMVSDASPIVDPRVEFVVLSNDASPAYRSRYLAAGAVRFLDKSIEFDLPAQAVQSARPGPVH